MKLEMGRSEKWKKCQEKGGKPGVNVRFTEIESGCHRNAAISAGRPETFAGENGVNFPHRGVLISRTVSGQTEWRLKPWWRIPIMAIALVSSIQVLTVVLSVVLTGCVDTKRI